MFTDGPLGTFFFSWYTLGGTLLQYPGNTHMPDYGCRTPRLYSRSRTRSPARWDRKSPLRHSRHRRHRSRSKSPLHHKRTWVPASQERCHTLLAASEALEQQQNAPSVGHLLAEVVVRFACGETALVNPVNGLGLLKLKCSLRDGLGRSKDR